MHRQAVQRAFHSMYETTQSAFMDLSSCDENEDAKTPQGIHDKNAYRLGEGSDNLGGIFLTLARMNHSCRPNANHYWREKLQQVLVFVARDIEIGEEMCKTYGPSAWMDTRSRREYLNERFSFHCMCHMCVEVNGGDDMMAKIQSLQEDIALSSSLTSSQHHTSEPTIEGGDNAAGSTVATLASIKKCLDLTGMEVMS